MLGARPRLLLVITEDSYFWSHRLGLGRAARDAGMDVHLMTRIKDHGKRIKDEGFTLLPIPFVRGSRNPVSELSAVLKLAVRYRQIKPDIVHHVAMKPMLYGSCAARIAGVPAVVNAFAGLGYAFIAQGWRAGLLRVTIRNSLRWALALPTNSRVISQNLEDYERLLREKIVPQSKVTMIRGSGVDYLEYRPGSGENDDAPIVLLAARMVWHKGVGEFIKAARILKRQGVRVRCVLVGTADHENPDSLSENELADCQKEGVVEWWGQRDDMPHVLANSHVVVLPSYTEGLPKILLEACACGIPVVASRVNGCREIVRDGENGILIPKKDAPALAAAIKLLLEDPPLRQRMGRRGREIVVEEFSAERVARETLAVYEELLDNIRWSSFTSVSAPRPTG